MIQVIEAHYKKQRPNLVKLFTFKAGSPEAAEDIIQESYYRAIKYQGSCKPGEFGKWINRILYNTLKDYKREEAGRAAVEFEEEDVDGTHCYSYSDQVMREVHKLITDKSEVQREVLEMHILHGYSAIDISRITDYSYANCHKIIQRFREEMKQLYFR
jgi:RNA polymerase sigma-70 factor, ECF subfamily